MSWTSKDSAKDRDPGIAPDVLLSYQKEWIADQSQVKFCEKSRRIGLSWSEAAEDSLLAASENGMNVFYIGYNQDMAREFISDCAAWSKMYNLAASEVEEFIWEDEKEENKKINAFRIKFSSEHEIVALSSRPANLRGKQGKIVIDEAAFHDDLAGLMKAALAMLIWGGRVVVISTHFGEDNPFNEKIEEVRSGKFEYSVHRITFDDALDAGLYQRVCLRLGKEWSEEDQAKWRQMVVDMYGEDADEELHCIPSKGGGAFLNRALIESCMSPDIPVFRWNPPAENFVDWTDEAREREVQEWLDRHVGPIIEKMPDRPSWVGGDFGRIVDLSSFWPLQMMLNMTYVTPFLIELRNCPFAQQEQIYKYLCVRLERFSGSALDARGNGAYLAERARQWFGADVVHEIQASQRWYLENMFPMKDWFEGRSLLIPKDAEVLDDLKAIKKIKGIPKIDDTRTVDSGGKKRHGDTAMALCMAVYAARNIEADSTYAYEAIRPSESNLRPVKAVAIGWRRVKGAI